MPTNESTAVDSLKGIETETRKALIKESMPDMYPEKEDE